MFAFFQRSIDRGMLEYVNTQMIEELQPAVNSLAKLYQQQGDWQTVRDNPKLLRHAFLPILRDKKLRHFFPPPDPDQKPRRGIALLDSNQQLVAGNEVTEHKTTRIAIQSSGQTVGWLILPQRRHITDGFELRFIEKQTQALLVISIAVLLVSIMIALPLSRHFVRPIKKLAAGALDLTQGRYQLTLDTQRKDELGELARDFKQLANTLQATESNRKRWLANTSHELRTPLAILRGELEAMLDGVRPVSIQNIQSAQQEVLHLAKLVDDLYQLSNADLGSLRYQKTSVDLAELLQLTVNSQQALFSHQGLQLTLQTAITKAPVWADSDRLQQLLNNLLANSQKYTDPEQGVVNITLNSDKDFYFIIIEDSAPGVPDDALQQLFDHLYRVESSRNRDTGGSGLGLAICQQIVAAHDGTIRAEHSELGGLKITVQLPIEPERSEDD